MINSIYIRKKTFHQGKKSEFPELVLNISPLGLLTWHLIYKIKCFIHLWKNIQNHWNKGVISRQSLMTLVMVLRIIPSYSENAQMHEAAWLCGQKCTWLGVCVVADDAMWITGKEGGQWHSSVPPLSSRLTQATGLLSWESWHLFWLVGSWLVLDSNPHLARWGVCIFGTQGETGGTSVLWRPQSRSLGWSHFLQKRLLVPAWATEPGASGEPPSSSHQW